MLVDVDSFYKEYYEHGHMDYILGTIQEHDTIDEWISWLKTEPIGFFEDNENYTLEGHEIKYQDEEVYAISMVVTHGQDVLFHSADGPTSMFYRLNDDDTITGIYVD